jgi:hypothetical protein
MNIIGKISKILPLESGVSKKGNEWKKQDVIITQLDTYSTDVCVTAFGEKAIKSINGFDVGDTVDIGCNVSSIEVNGKYYTNINGWSWANQNNNPEVNDDFVTSDNDLF